MKVGKALAVTLFAASTAASPKENERSFGGVLAHVADDAAGQPAATSAKVKTAESKDAETKIPTVATSAVNALSAGLVGETAKVSTSDTTASDLNSSAKGRSAKAGASDDHTVDTTDDQTASPTLVAVSSSLLALVQIAAFAPNARSTDVSPASGPSVSVLVAKTRTSLASPDQTDPSALLVKTTTDPLVSNVALQSHLAPTSISTSTSTSTKDDVPTNEADTVGPNALAAGASASVAMSGASEGDARSGQSGHGCADEHGPAAPETTADETTSDGLILAADPTLAVASNTIVSGSSSLSVPSAAVAEAVTSSISKAAPQATTITSMAPARTMVLQLSPGDLGTVSVRLHLTGHTLDVSLTASNAGTASLLDHDRAALISALGDRDYQLNSLVIQGGDAVSTPGDSSASTNSSGGRSASQSTPDQQGGGGNARGGDRDPSARRGGSGRGPASASPGVARGDALFV